MVRPQPGEVGYSEYAQLFNDVTRATHGSTALFSERARLVDVLWELGYRIDAAPRGVLEKLVADPEVLVELRSRPTWTELVVDGRLEVQSWETSWLTDHGVVFVDG